MVYGISKAGRGRVVYFPIAVQKYCTSVGNAGGPEEWKDDWLVHKQLKVKQYPVKAIPRPRAVLVGEESLGGSLSLCIDIDIDR